MKGKDPFSGFRKGMLVVCMNALLSLLIFSCASEEIEPDTSNSPSHGGESTEIIFPGFVGFKISSIDGKNTRAGVNDITDPSIGDSFDDGSSSSEYKLTTATDDYHHFAIICPKNDYTGKPYMVMPLRLKEMYPFDGTVDDNVTFIAHHAIANEEVLTQDDIELDNIDDFGKFKNKNGSIFDHPIIVILNFDKSLVNWTEYSDLENPTNGELLFDLTFGNIVNDLISADYRLSIKDNKVVKAGTADATDYFLMSNSIFFTRAGDTYPSYAWTGVTTPKAYPSEQEALDNPVASVYVERVATKVSVEFSVPASNVIEPDSPEAIYSIRPSSTIQLYDSSPSGGVVVGEDGYEIKTNPKRWSLEVLGYGLNAVEPKGYLFKHLTSGTTYFSNWTQPEAMRSYWAEDPHYNVAGEAEKYPDQFRRALETINDVRNLHNNGYTGDGKIDVSSLKTANLQYHHFNYFKGKNEIIYNFENTYKDDQGSTLGERGYFSASSHLILACRMKIDGETATEFYSDQNDIFYVSENDIFSTKLELLNKIVLNGGNHGIRVLDANWLRINGYEPDNSDGGLTKISWSVNSLLWVKYKGQQERLAEAGDFRLIEAEISGGDGQLLIAPSAEIEAVYLAPSLAQDEQGKTLDSRDVSNSVRITGNQLISLIHKMIGPIDHYKDGYMYYAGAIPHAKNSVGKDSWKTLGDIGMVRNNWYSVKITDITGVGRPVDNPDQPIIPTQEVKRNYLNMSVTIIDYHDIVENVPESKL